MAIISHITQLLAPIISHHPTSFSATHMDTNYTNTSPSHRKPHSNNQSNGPIIPNTCTYHQGWRQKFLFGGPSYNTNIFIKTTPPHTHIHVLFYYINILFYLISYIYTHPTKKKKKRSLVFSIKLCLMTIFHKIKFIFIVKFLKNFIFDTNYQILY